MSDVKIQIAVNSRTGEAKIKALGDKFDVLGRRGKAAFKQVNAGSQRLNKSMTKVMGLATGLAGAFGLWHAGNLAGDVIDVASSFEMLEVKLDALTNGKGTETLEAINAWALEMPVNTRQAVDTFAMMQAMGLDPTIEKMQILVDTASIFGQDAMPRVARALGQMTTLGKLSAEELNQLSEAGINARKYLKEAFGQSVEEIKASGVEISKVTDAIWRGLAGDYGGSAQKAMENWEGLKATFVSYVEEIERKVMAAGLFEELKDQLGGVNDQLVDWIANNDELIKQKVPEYVTDIKTSVTGVVDVYTGLPDGVIGAAGTGVLGRVLFGGWGPAKVAALLYYINEQMDQMGHGLGDLVEKNQRAARAFEDLWQSIKDVGTGKKHWWTGEDLTPKNPLAGIGTTYQGEFAGVTDHMKKMLPVLDKTNAALAKRIRLQNALAAQARGTYDLDHGPWDAAQFDVYDPTPKVWTKEDWEEYGNNMKKAQADTYEDFGHDLDGMTESLEIATGEWVELTEWAAMRMEQNFSDLYFDAFRGEMDSLGDYLNAFWRSAQRAMADYMGMLTKEALFGSETKTSILSTGWNAVKTWWTGSAHGNLFSGGHLVPFAKGGLPHGVVNSPFVFNMGIAGEAGPEVIAPLFRGSHGDLGVKATPPVVHIHNHTGAGVTHGTNAAGELEIVIGAVAADMRAGGPTGQAAVQAVNEDIRMNGQTKYTIKDI